MSEIQYEENIAISPDYLSEIGDILEDLQSRVTEDDLTDSIDDFDQCVDEIRYVLAYIYRIE